MKITDVRAVQPACASPPDWRTSMGQILVAIDTDAGLTGHGVGGGGLAGIHVVRTVLRDALLGRDPDRIPELWDVMYGATLAFGRKGLAIMALSGADLALWDLRGKAQSRPVAELLGGSMERAIPTYHTAWGQIDPALLGQHRAFKLHVGEDDTPDRVEVVARAVEKARATVGRDCPLMVDAWMKWDVPTTLQIADRLVPLDVAWIEEPLSPDNLAGYVELCDHCPIPIAGGEHEFTAVGFEPLIDGRLHRVLQPDVCWCGGLTALIEIYRMARAVGLRVCPHRGAEVWALHALAALDPDPLAESGRPWMTWVRGQPPIRDGFIRLTDEPGFGAGIDEDRLTPVG
ncbi:MAG: mandelate racemase/muconate lactonizing enzyme family protein [Gemmataceae bacterium]|nr:mandelate racemase/muconate lactonizing enzyme family protein [Gemmataceae bacterium]